MPHRPPPARRAAFTLVEVMIATALGVTIIGTAFAAFRVASQAATVANRLSLENAMLRAGFSKAEEELDFWQAYDDPQQPALEQLRTARDAGAHGLHGLAFAPMAALLTASANPAHMEDALGWSPSTWLPHDPRSWFRGNMAEKYNSSLPFGRYAIFSNVDDAPALSGGALPGYKVVGVPHHWHDRQVQCFLANGSFFQLCEYLPPNAIYAYMQGSDGSTNAGGIPKFAITPGDSQHFCNTDGDQRNARGKYRQTYRTSWALAPADKGLSVQNTDPTFVAQAFTDRWALQRRYFETGYASAPADMQGFVDLTTITTPLLDQAPANWPRVQVSVNRFVKNARCVALFRLRITNPLTGTTSELSFTGFGTTLRGARQQRFFDPNDNRAVDDPDRQRGWARWDDAAASAPDPTLDSAKL